MSPRSLKPKLQNRALTARKQHFLAAVHSCRWHVELDFRSIKDGMQMDVLRCKTLEMVRKEVAVHLLAYNLVRTVTAQAATLARVLPRRLSFKAALQTLNAFLHCLRECPPRSLPQRHATLLAAIARLLIPERPDRVEPRAVKRRPKASSAADPATKCRARAPRKAATAHRRSFCLRQCHWRQNECDGFGVCQWHAESSRKSLTTPALQGIVTSPRTKRIASAGSSQPAKPASRSNLRAGS
jgi:hypothetical protein